MANAAKKTESNGEVVEFPKKGKAKTAKKETKGNTKAKKTAEKAPAKGKAATKQNQAPAKGTAKTASTAQKTDKQKLQEVNAENRALKQQVRKLEQFAGRLVKTVNKSMDGLEKVLPSDSGPTNTGTLVGEQQNKQNNQTKQTQTKGKAADTKAPAKGKAASKTATKKNTTKK